MACLKAISDKLGERDGSAVPAEVVRVPGRAAGAKRSQLAMKSSPYAVRWTVMQARDLVNAVAQLVEQNPALVDETELPWKELAGVFGHTRTPHALQNIWRRLGRGVPEEHVRRLADKINFLQSYRIPELLLKRSKYYESDGDDGDGDDDDDDDGGGSDGGTLSDDD